MKKYGIGYTIFEYNGTVRQPIVQFKPMPENFSHAMHLLELKMKKLNSDHKLFSICGWALMYGFSVRVLLAI